MKKNVQQQKFGVGYRFSVEHGHCRLYVFFSVIQIFNKFACVIFHLYRQAKIWLVRT